MTSEQEAYNELCAYTLSLRDPTFIHQHVVDAYAAQHAGNATKPIGIAFALVGLYLFIEKGFSGKAVQRVHMKLAERKQEWPTFILPKSRGTMTVVDVMRNREGPERNKAIHTWCASVWTAYMVNRDVISELLRRHKIA